MTRDEQRMDLWCKVVVAYAGSGQVGHYTEVTAMANVVLDAFDKRFPSASRAALEQEQGMLRPQKISSGSAA